MIRFYTNVYLHKNEFLIRGYEGGDKVQYAVPCRPYLFVNDRVSLDEYKTLHGKTVYRKEFDSTYEARAYIASNSDISGKEVYGMSNWVYPFINDHYHGEIQYDPKKISAVTIDIEIKADGGFPDISVADRQVTAITLTKNGDSVVFGYYDYKPSLGQITYVKCKDENDLLNKFITVWRSKQFLPDIITGWNVEFFDMPYMINRITRILGPESAKRLSPWGLLSERNIEIAGREYTIPVIIGITILDYMQLYKKFSFSQQESYKLDDIAFTELGERKLDFNALGFDTLDEFYEKDFQNYIEYNIRDVALVDRLEDKLKLIEQVYAIAYDAKVNYLDTFTSVRMWDIIIHNYLIEKNIVVPMFNVAQRKEKDRSIVGAYVKDPQLGMHNWVVSFDLNSLYPHLIMQYNISPETCKGTFGSLSDDSGVDRILDGALNDFGIRNELKAQNYTVAASGCYFDKDRQGFLPELMEQMYNDRVKYKTQMIEAKKKYEQNPSYELEKEIARCDNMQLAKKIQLNSAYGALANIFFRWFDPKYAESITKSGQLSIRWIERRMNAYLNKTLKTVDVDYVLAVDTDSMYITLNELVKQTAPDQSTEKVVKYLDKFCNKVLEPYIDKCYDELAEYVNAYAQKMKMKREVISDKGIFTAKKRYILNVHNLEGVQYTEPKLKMMGIEAVRSSTPAPVRKMIRDAIIIIMTKTEDDMIKYIEHCRNEFKRLPFEQIAFPRGISELEKWADYNGGKVFKLGTPIHVKGALLFNHVVKLRKLEKKYDTVKKGEKIKFCYLKTPNYLGEHVISTPGKLPKELDLDDMIDHDTQFDKAFIEPIKNILDIIGWKTEKRNTLDSFFV